ncbi:MAG TPA: (d)CMP kinase [Candidatus Kapabacteria bacterium]|nr:(d)CMP kinase [Candidatus Kapabacteria bacterium]
MTRRKKGIIIAIDGPTASGKSTTAKLVANKLGFLHLNTGAMYRAVALRAKEENCPKDDLDRLHSILDDIRLSFDEDGNILLSGRNVSKEVRLPEIATLASELSTIPEVRERLVARQQEIGSEGAVVLEGRDIGTVVFPDAELKIFLVADPSVRAERRVEEMHELGSEISLEEMKRQLAERDKRDIERTLSPLTKASDAVELDTTHLTIDGQVEKVVELARERMRQLGIMEPQATPAVNGTAS